MLYNRPNIFFKKQGSWAPFFIRTITGVHLLYGVIDHVISAAKMQTFAQFLTQHNVFAPTLAAYVSIYMQFLAGVSYILGFYQRTSAFVMIIHFIFALLIVHIGDTYTHTFPALFMLAASISLFFSGAGRLSIDQVKRRRRK